jgi:hypothetical protein
MAKKRIDIMALKSSDTPARKWMCHVLLPPSERRDCFPLSGSAARHILPDAHAGTGSDPFEGILVLSSPKDIS